MSYRLMAVEDRVDTGALQEMHPEWFIVTGEKHAEYWTLRPDIKAAMEWARDAERECARQFRFKRNVGRRGWRRLPVRA